MSTKYLLLFASLMGFFAVAAGAFGAHALKQRLTHESLSIFEIGVRYQMYHALAIFVAVWLSTIFSGPFPIYAGWSFFIGTLIFSGSLYVLALSGIKAFGAITPIGGVILLLGWIFLTIGILKNN